MILTCIFLFKDKYIGVISGLSVMGVSIVHLYLWGMSVGINWVVPIIIILVNGGESV